MFIRFAGESAREERRAYTTAIEGNDGRLEECMTVLEKGLASAKTENGWVS